MKDSEIYLRAAELIYLHEGHGVYLPVLKSTPKGVGASKRLALLIAIDLVVFSDLFGTSKDMRSTALCFMAAIAKDEGR